MTVEQVTRIGAARKSQRSTEAEQSVIGGLLLDNRAWDRIRDILTADDFYHREHRLIYNAIAALCEEASPADIVTVTEGLEKSGELEAVGGFSYLALVANNTPSAANITAYANIVREHADARKLLLAASDIIEAIHDPTNKTAGAMQEFATRRIAQIRIGGGKSKQRAVTVCMADVEPEAISWLWPGRIAAGKVTLIVGDPGLGKSFVTLDMAARITSGGRWPDTSKALMGNVILLSAEDDAADTIRPRLDAAGADSSRVHILQAVRTQKDGQSSERAPLLTDIDALAEAIERIGNVNLIVIDPITAYLGGDVDSHKNSDIRGLLAPLAALAARYDVAVVGVSHLNKSQGNAIYRTMGSLAFTAAARGVWCVTKDKDDENRRLFLPVKNNIGPDHGGLAYRIIDDRGQVSVAWESDPVHIDINDALAADRDEDHPERVAATDWLRDLLAAGPMAATEVQRHAKESGQAWATVRRAQVVLGIKPAKTRFDGGWEWALPTKLLNATSSKTVSTFAVGEHLREFPEEKNHSQVAENTEYTEGAEDAHHPEDVGGEHLGMNTIEQICTVADEILPQVVRRLWRPAGNGKNGGGWRVTTLPGTRETVRHVLESQFKQPVELREAQP